MSWPADVSGAASSTVAPPAPSSDTPDPSGRIGGLSDPDGIGDIPVNGKIEVVSAVPLTMSGHDAPLESEKAGVTITCAELRVIRNTDTGAESNVIAVYYELVNKTGYTLSKIDAVNSYFKYGEELYAGSALSKYDMGISEMEVNSASAGETITTYKSAVLPEDNPLLDLTLVFNMMESEDSALITFSG